MTRKVSDMNKDFVINFLQEYSHYIKVYRKLDDVDKIFDIMCPTEFFQSRYLDILKETEQIESAFGREPDIDHKDQKYLNYD